MQLPPHKIIAQRKPYRKITIKRIGTLGVLYFNPKTLAIVDKTGKWTPQEINTAKQLVAQERDGFFPEFAGQAIKGGVSVNS